MSDTSLFSCMSFATSPPIPYTQVDLNETIVVIRQPKVPISCRTQGELLLGCVRIYATKVSLLLKESSEPMSIPEPNEPGKRRPPIEDREVKEKRVTMAGGLENLVAIQEIASFDINEVFATSVHELPIAEGFNMEEWWGKSPEPLAMPGGMEPSKSPQSRNSVQQPVNLASEDEDPFRLAGNDVMLQMSEPVSGGDVSGGGIPTEQFPSPMTDPPLPVEKAVVPVPPPAAKPVSVAVFDPLTTLDQATLKKWTTNTTPITQDLALLPRTEEELELMKERRLTLDDMMFRAEPPLKRRRIDITGLASAHFIGMDDVCCISCKNTKKIYYSGVHPRVSTLIQPSFQKKEKKTPLTAIQPCRRKEVPLPRGLHEGSREAARRTTSVPYTPNVAWWWHGGWRCVGAVHASS